MELHTLRELAASGRPVGQGGAATAEDVAAVAGPLLVHASRWPMDIAFRSALTWPILQHAAWGWRVADHTDGDQVAWALALQHRADMLGYIEVAIDAVDHARRGAPAGMALKHVREALSAHTYDLDQMDRLPPELPLDVVIPLAVRRWDPEHIPGDLLVKCQLFVGATLAMEDGFSHRELIDVYVVLLDDLSPIATKALSQAA